MAGPVPYVLGSYFAFTLLRLGLAHRFHLSAPVLALSVVADMALLMVTIWSFHIKYGQPPAFYLKAPTLLYVFIFIALRALRFEANYVILAGITAALGWLILVGLWATLMAVRQLRGLLIQIVLALFLSFAMEPAVDRLGAHAAGVVAGLLGESS